MIYRPPSSPQVIRFGLAVFLTAASGPGAPQGKNDSLQAQIAYRGPTNIVAAMPKPASVAAIVSTGAQGPTAPMGSTARAQALIAYRGLLAIQHPKSSVVAPALAVTIGPTVSLGSTSVWQALAAYRAPPRAEAVQETLRLAPEPAPFAGIAAIYLGGLAVQPPYPRPWPYQVAEPAIGIAAVIPVAAQLPAAPSQSVAVASAWPYAIVEQWRLDPVSAPYTGIATVYLGPPSVVAAATAQWPYYLAGPAKAIIAPEATQLAALSPAQVGASPWPYAAIEEWRLAPLSSWHAGIVAISLAPQPSAVPTQFSVSQWPYAALTPFAAPLAAIATGPAAAAAASEPSQAVGGELAQFRAGRRRATSPSGPLVIMPGVGVFDFHESEPRRTLPAPADARPIERGIGQYVRQALATARANREGAAMAAGLLAAAQEQRTNDREEEQRKQLEEEQRKQRIALILLIALAEIS